MSIVNVQAIAKKPSLIGRANLRNLCTGDWPGNRRDLGTDQSLETMIVPATSTTLKSNSNMSLNTFVYMFFAALEAHWSVTYKETYTWAVYAVTRIFRVSLFIVYTYNSSLAGYYASSSNMLVSSWQALR